MWRAGMLLVLAVVFAASASAQVAPAELRMSTRVLPPMVVQQDGALGGFSIDLWNAIAGRLQITTAYQVAPDVQGLLNMIRTGAADAGISAISITAARETEFEFSQPMMNAGLAIMVRGAGSGSQATVMLSMLRDMISPTGAIWLGIGLLLVLLPAHLMYFSEHNDAEGTVPKPYFPGIFHAIFWSFSTLVGAGEMPHRWLARIIAVLWIFLGVNAVAFYTAHLTATLTVSQVTGNINGPDDLHGKLVATTVGSTAATALSDLGADVRAVTRIEDAFQALVDGKVDAVVFDSPILRHFAANEGRHQVRLVGEVFHNEDYGIVFPLNSPLRKRVNGALLSLKEDGTYQKIYDRWFAQE